ncbi:MAG: DNA/RNA non-specific endonuclease [Candidatus Riflebacteria bacterium]|nr:DNA/RNA non-specific endonuclease [Candidatus Riflebacteria bacterium]
MIEALAANTIKAGVETLAVEAAKEISGQAALEKMQILNQPENFRIGEVLNPEICNKSELKAEENNAIESIQNKLSLFEKNVPKMEDVQQVKTNYENPNNEVEKVKNNPITNLTPSETSKEFIENSVKIEYDDNNTPYRIGDELIPNTDYEINGYHYHTDESGRITCVEGTLHIKNREGRLPIKDSIETIGKGDQKETDDRGHLIGDQFDGSNGMENMIPQDANINRGDYNKLEQELAKEVKDGKKVEVKIEPQYEGESRRPSNIVVSYTINGETSVRIFPNDVKKG